MSDQETLRRAFLSLEVKDTFSEASLSLTDRTRLCFCHKVGERWAKAVGPEGAEEHTGAAGEILALIVMFRLNAKHLDISFLDGSRWEMRF